MPNEVKSPWPGPAGLIPVTSGRPEDANVHNRAYLDQILVEMRVIDSVKPDLMTQIFGETFASPIMMPAFSHLNKTGSLPGREPMTEYAVAAKELNLLNWVGMEDNDTYEAIAGTGARTVRIIKPFADHDMIRDQIRFAIEHNAIAVGIDVDHIVGTNGDYDVVDGMPLGPVLSEDLEGYVRESSVPFVAKGILSVQDALKARDIGCAAIVVSHHHGRIPFGIPPVSVLPAIRKALEGSCMTIFCDCSMDSGADVYKAMALGADAVSVGRTILKPLLSDGTAGVVQQVTKITQDLTQMMMYTGVRDTRSFDPCVLHFREGLRIV